MYKLSKNVLMTISKILLKFYHDKTIHYKNHRSSSSVFNTSYVQPPVLQNIGSKREEYMQTISIHYSLRLAGDMEEVFHVTLDAHHHALVHDIPNVLPQWTSLEYYQCPNCTLDADIHPYCQLIAHLVNVVDRFKNILSYDEIDMDVITVERRIYQRTKAQRGTDSLMGLIIATSGCPHTGFFNPMARCQLPLASQNESICRTASMYLLAQYFIKNEREQADLDLEGLRDIYHNIQVVNSAAADRIGAATEADSLVNTMRRWKNVGGNCW
jgi:hypothetical protein